jgi:hypothetical protein
MTVACCLAIGCSGMRSRINDEKAQQVMWDVRLAEDTFKQRRGRYGTWKELIDAGLLSQSLADGVAFGHRFELRTSGKGYESVTVPAEKDDQMAYVGWSFYLDDSGVIRGHPYGRDDGYAIAGKNDPPVRSQQ